MTVSFAPTPRLTLSNVYDNSPELQDFHQQNELSGATQFERGWNSAGLSEQAQGLMANAAELYNRGDTQNGAVLEQQAKDLMSRAQQWAPTTQNFTDINSPGTAVDWLGGALGNMRTSVKPALAGLAGGVAGAGVGLMARNPALGIRAGSAVGSFLGGYDSEYNEALSNAMMDEQIRKNKSYQEMIDASRVKGVAAGALESIVPGTLAGSVLGQGVKRGIGRTLLKEAGTEFATEGSQSLVGQATENYLKDKGLVEDLDYKQAFNEGMAGAVGGGGMALGTHGANVAWDAARGGAKKVADVVANPMETVGNAIADGGAKAGDLAGTIEGKANGKAVVEEAARRLDAMSNEELLNYVNNGHRSNEPSFTAEEYNSPDLDTLAKDRFTKHADSVLSRPEGDHSVTKAEREAAAKFKLDGDYNAYNRVVKAEKARKETDAFATGLNGKKSLMSPTLTDDFGEQEGRYMGEDTVTNDFGDRVEGAGTVSPHGYRSDHLAANKAIKVEATKDKANKIRNNVASALRSIGVKEKWLEATAGMQEEHQRRMVALLEYLEDGSDVEAGVHNMEKMYGDSAKKVFDKALEVASHDGLLSEEQKAFAQEVSKALKHSSSYKSKIATAIDKSMAFFKKEQLSKDPAERKAEIGHIHKMLEHLRSNIDIVRTKKRGSNTVTGLQDHRLAKALVDNVFGTFENLNNVLDLMPKPEGVTKATAGLTPNGIEAEEASELADADNDIEAGRNMTEFSLPENTDFQRHGVGRDKGAPRPFNMTYSDMEEKVKSEEDKLKASSRQVTRVGVVDDLKYEIGKGNVSADDRHDYENALLNTYARQLPETGKYASLIKQAAQGTFEVDDLTRAQRETLLGLINKNFVYLHSENVGSDPRNLNERQIDNNIEKRVEAGKDTPAHGIIYLERNGKPVPVRVSRMLSKDNAAISNSEDLGQRAEGAGLGASGWMDLILAGLSNMQAAQGFSKRIGVMRDGEIVWGDKLPDDLVISQNGTTIADAKARKTDERKKDTQDSATDEEREQSDRDYKIPYAETPAEKKTVLSNLLAEIESKLDERLETVPKKRVEAVTQRFLAGVADKLGMYVVKDSGKVYANPIEVLKDRLEKGAPAINKLYTHLRNKFDGSISDMGGTFTSRDLEQQINNRRMQQKKDESDNPSYGDDATVQGTSRAEDGDPKQVIRRDTTGRRIGIGADAEFAAVEGKGKEGAKADPVAMPSQAEIQKARAEANKPNMLQKFEYAKDFVMNIAKDGVQPLLDKIGKMDLKQLDILSAAIFGTDNRTEFESRVSDPNVSTQKQLTEFNGKQRNVPAEKTVYTRVIDKDIGGVRTKATGDTFLSGVEIKSGLTSLSSKKIAELYFSNNQVAAGSLLNALRTNEKAIKSKIAETKLSLNEDGTNPARSNNSMVDQARQANSAGAETGVATNTSAAAAKEGRTEEVVKQDAWVMKVASMSIKDIREMVKALPYEKLEKAHELLESFYPANNTNAFWQRNDLDLYSESFEKSVDEAISLIEDRLYDEAKSSKPQAKNTSADRVILPAKSAYTTKDQVKSDKANKFIGRGSAQSSTAAYAKAWGDRANTGSYSSTDKVFVSAEGNRQGRIAPDFKELGEAVKAGATFITDNEANRGRVYNVGEREVAEFLEKNGYSEVEPGVWSKAKHSKQQAKQQATQEEQDAAKQIIDIMLGDSVKVEFKKFFKDGSSGKWIEKIGEENLIQLAKNSDVLSTAYHEAIHELFSIMKEHGTDQTRALLERVSNNPIIRREMERLLINHPDAQAQLKDPEEAVAFMFQFANMGQLKIGPETKTFFEQVAHWLKQIAAIFSETVRNKLREQKIVDMDRAEASKFLAQFARGDLRDSATRQAVMASIEKNTEQHNEAVKRVGEQWASMVATAGKLVMSAEAVMDATNNEYFVDVARWFHNKAGTAMQRHKVTEAEAIGGFLQALHGAKAEWLNKLDNVFEGADKKDVELVRKALARGDKTSTDPVVNALMQKVQKFYAEMGKYMQNSDVRRWDEEANGKMGDWVKIQLRKDYGITQAWNAEYVQQHAEEFMADLIKHHKAELEKLAKEANNSLAAWQKSEKGDVPLKSAAQAELDRATQEALDKAAAAGKAGGKMAIQQVTVEDIAKQIVLKLMNAGGRIDLQESDSRLGLTPAATAVNRRELTWLDGDAFDKYKEQDLIKIMSSYTQQLVNRAESQKRFGYGGERIRDNVDRGYLYELGGKELVKTTEILLKKHEAAWRKNAAKWYADPVNAGEKYPEPFPTLRSVGFEFHRTGVGNAKHAEALTKAHKKLAPSLDAIRAMEGTLGADISPAERTMNSWVTTYQNFRLLGTMLFSSFADVNGIVVNGGEMKDAWNAFVTGIREIRNTWVGKKDTKGLMAEAELWGTVDAGSYMDSLGQSYGSVFMTGKAKELSDSFFKWTGAEGWNRGIRGVATQVGKRIIEDWAKNGINMNDKAQVAQFEHLFGKGADPKSIALTPEGHLDVMDEANKAAVQRWVLDSITTPTAANRPIWGSNPRYAMLMHLKNFTYAQHRVILGNAMAQAQLGNYRPMLAAMSGYIPIMIAGGAIKEMLIPGDEPPWMKGGLDGYLSYGWDRAGVLGVPQMYANGLKDPLSILGPTADQIQNIMTVPFGEFNADLPLVGKLGWEDHTALGEGLGSLPGGVLLRRIGQ